MIPGGYKHTGSRIELPVKLQEKKNNNFDKQTKTHDYKKDRSPACCGRSDLTCLWLKVTVSLSFSFDYEFQGKQSSIKKQSVLQLEPLWFQNPVISMLGYSVRCWKSPKTNFKVAHNHTYLTQFWLNITFAISFATGGSLQWPSSCKTNCKSNIQSKLS